MSVAEIDTAVTEWLTAKNKLVQIRGEMAMIRDKAITQLGNANFINTTDYIITKGQKVRRSLPDNLKATYRKKTNKKSLQVASTPDGIIILKADMQDDDMEMNAL